MKGKAYRWKEKGILINSKLFWRGNAGIRSGIGHHESRRLHEKCARQLAQTSWMTFVLGEAIQHSVWDNFPSFSNGIKVSSRNTASEIYSEFMYVCWRLWSPCYSLYFAKGKSFIVQCMHTLSLNSKFLIERNLSLLFWQPLSSTVRGKSYA